MRGSRVAMFWRDYNGDCDAEKKKKKLFALWGEFDRIWVEIYEEIYEEEESFSDDDSSSDDCEEDLFFPLSFFVGELVE